MSENWTGSTWLPVRKRTKTASVVRQLLVDVLSCEHCGGEHKNVLIKVKDKYRWWLLCPETGQPIVVNQAG